MNSTGLGSPMTFQSVDTLVLFDLMSHSVQSYVYQYVLLFFLLIYGIRDSGIGDHGQEGIDAFTSQHSCNIICLGLGLKSLSNEGDGSSKGVSDGEDGD